MIYTTAGNPSKGMTFTDCPPSGLNETASSLATSAVSGQRAGTPPKFSNLDCSGLRVVKRGSLVEFPGGASARVCRVRLGYFYTDVDALVGRHGCVYRTAAVRVVA